jgi:DNA topoisomerase-2
VNSICTIKGGSHVNYLADQIVERIMEVLKKKHKSVEIKAHQVK